MSPITAHFGVDFSNFLDGVQKADASLKSFESDANKVEKSLNRMVDQFSGRKVAQEATLMTEAITRMGGATILTEKEQQRVNATLTEAIAKFRAIGKDAPQAMIDLAAATSHSGESFGGLIGVMREVGSSFVARVAEGMLLRDAIREVIGGVKDLVVALPELALQGAAVDDVEHAFKRLTDQSGHLSETLLTTLRQGTHGTITDFDLMKRANQDLAAGMNLTDAQFGTLAQGAYALAKATGTDVKTALDTMSDAMLTGRARSVALLTGKIDLQAAEERYARSLGTTADHLSAEGKIEADRRAILDAVAAATDRLGVQTDNLDDRVKQV